MQTLDDLHIAPKSKLTPESIAALDRQTLHTLLCTDSLNSLIPCLAVTAAKYHLSTGGHRIRSILALHAGKCLGLTHSDTQTLAVACELLHNASLIHDDLHDRDTHRRGKLSVWHKFGDEAAICAGDLLLSASYIALSQLSNVAQIPKLFALMHCSVTSAIHGQCFDLARPKNNVMTIEDYKNIALNKSGALLSLPTELALLAANENLALPQAREAAVAFAIAYQIHDDLIDVKEDAISNFAKPFATNQTTERAVSNIVLILQSNPHCEDARIKAKIIALQHLSVAAPVCQHLPSNSGGALHAMCLELKHELESIE